MLLTGVLFVGVTGIVRHLGSALPAIEMAFIRYAFGVLLVAPTLLFLFRILPSLKVTRLFAIRGFLHAVGVCLWFYAMARIPIAEVTAIGYVAPIFVTVGAALFLGEKLHARRIISVIVGFLGALIILRPGFQEINSGQLAQLCAAPIFAASFLMAKRMTDNQDSGVIVAMLTLFCTIALMPGALYYWQTPSHHEIGWLFFASLSATWGHYTLTRSVKAAPITMTQPLSFLQLVWATLLGVTLFDEAINIYVILGGGVVIASVTYTSHREAKAARKLDTAQFKATKVW